MSDWLDIDGPPEKVGLPAVVTAPLELADRVRLVEDCWSRLSLHQRMFLTAWRENRFNARAAARALGSVEKHRSHHSWTHQPDYATVVQIWRAAAASQALDKDRLLARQDDIVETLLTPKPVLHQGVPTGYYEVEAGAASRANEVLLDRAMPKPRADVEVNVGVAFMPPSVEVVKSAGTTTDAVDAEVVEVSPAIPKEDSDVIEGS